MVYKVNVLICVTTVTILCILAGLYTADIVNYRKRCKTAKIKEYKVMKLQVQTIY